ncbi:MAG TPA: ATP phosphoribosyltransferase regulatory subunit [Ottowia sp.]|uniref:ATP phosphoribosyltransferase regulatory subunit n=1 Tax=Ottowia sp. TaxID=1898956 RepID=UPI0011D4EC73|nr:ATP phosphoribosyltransferase regulatory subunit [Ottowia sp.]TXI21236.1 MAG: ATP phosphoribosyltransferase regulatory subunit [Ottowia sp.]HNE60699.1 ATP phosphoribosyltransferase regulatory subunit [Ottowia sp.]HNI84943.1 ATP phosphoribosyltransferase regulatory subunit [Ottowia sp.]HNJ46580.1 ATP phosphoribosyltransferase regulatory subunit [Ottowia sp.]HNN33936.1 ATP phosphoribosyltransferase regulatory subunit [Ottowia sp.]
MSAWLLPDHIADVLPSEARHIEELRRELLDTARGYGYELVIPPLIEHLESLLTGTGEALGLQTFKLVDQLSGRSLGVRADTTPQVARIDAHLLGRQAVTRLCYCGPVLHTQPERPHATREPLQLGAEIYGHAGREADLEILSLALDCLRAAPVHGLSVDLADARIVRALLAGVLVDPERLTEVHLALAAKDASELARLTAAFPASARQGLCALVGLYGDAGVLDEAEKALSGAPGVREVLSNLKWLASQLEGVRVSFDLADARGWGYYTGARFAVYAEGAGDALLRGGRYDGVGAVFGHKLDRERPAVGFSLDLKQLVGVAAPRPLRAAIRAPWGDAPGLRKAVAGLRRRGETVVCALPGHADQIDEFHCDRELIEAGGQWVIQALG